MICSITSDYKFYTFNIHLDFYYRSRDATKVTLSYLIHLVHKHTVKSADTPLIHSVRFCTPYFVLMKFNCTWLY